MSLVSRLGVVLGLDSAEFSAGLGKAESSLGKFGTSSLAAGVSVAAIGTAFISAASSAVMFADGINDIAQANDLAVGSVLEFTQALSVSGGHAENATKLLSSLTSKIDAAAGGSQKTRDRFKELGVSLKDLGTLSEQDLLEKTIQGLAQIEDPIHRNALAFEIFGKAIKGVDIVGFNEQLQALKGTGADADKPFSDIGDSLDRLDVLSRKMKTDLAINIAEPLKIATEAVSNFYDWLGKINGWIETKSDGFNLWDILLPMKGAIKADAKLAEWIAAKRKAMQDDANSGHYTPIDTMVHPDYGNAPNPNKRTIEQTPEQIAAAKKLADEYKKQLEALQQQEASLKNQNTDLNELYPTYAKLIQEFEKGGKLKRLKNTADETELLNQALKVDQEKQYVEHAKEGAKQAIQTEQRERAAREAVEAEQHARMKEVAQMAIQQHQVYQSQMENAQIERERLDLATSLVGQSDSQVQKALALFDVEKEMIRIKKENPNMTQQELDDIKAVKVATIDAKETNTRAQKTFQAGWDTAWSNYKEKALDSATIAQQGFNSMTSSMESALDTFVSTGKLSFSSLAQSIIQDLIKIQLKAQVTGLFSLLTGGVGASGGGFGDMFSGIWGSAPLGEAGSGSGIMGFLSGLGFADGGSPPVGKASLVGERGAELFIPKTAGTIIPNNQLSSMMGNQPQVVYNAPYIANLQTIDSKSFEQRLYQSSGAVWAANAYANKSMATTGGRT